MRTGTMRYASPLRYPGGKASLTPLLRGIRRLNDIEDFAIAEPFAGGAGASLSLLYAADTPEIHINDFDVAIHDFWWSAVHNSAGLLHYLDTVPISVKEWERWRAVYHSARASRLRRGFAAFYLNRCNRSGIIKDGSVIGGLDQRGPWKIGARFNRQGLRERLQRLAAFAERIHVTGDDGIDFLGATVGARTMWFLDPPYYAKGPTLYMNGLDPAYHERLAQALAVRQNTAWVLTYDDCPEIRALYSDWASMHPFSLRYVAAERRSGNEVLITPKWMEIPRTQGSAAIAW